MNNIRRFRYVKPIYKKSVILNNLKLYKRTDYALVNNNKKSYSNLIKYNKSELVPYDKSELVSYDKSELVPYDKSELVSYDKSDLGLVLYQLNNKLLNYKSNKYLHRYILFKIAYFIA